MVLCTFGKWTWRLIFITFLPTCVEIGQIEGLSLEIKVEVDFIAKQFIDLSKTGYKNTFNKC